MLATAFRYRIMPKKKLPFEVDDAPMVNRAAVILVPTEAYFEWTKTFPDANPATTLAHVRQDPTVVLIPESDTPGVWVDEHFLDLFEHELVGWCRDEASWPRQRTRRLFYDFFDVHIGTMVLDVVQGPVIKD